MIPFNGEYTKKEWSRGIQLAARPRGWAVVARLVALALVVLGVVLIVSSVVQGNVNGSRVVRLAISMVFLAGWAALPYFRAWRAQTAPWRRPEGPPRLRGVVTSDGILHDPEAGGTLDTWDTLVRADVRDDLVVLIGADRLATVLPRSFFSSEQDWQSFRQMVDMNVVAPR